MIQSISLKKLVPSPRNVRKSSDVLADLQLRADIAARGLLQNLVVRKGKRGKFEVEAGGRRLSALQALAEEDTLPDTHEVTCLVIEGEESEVREASLAENFQRLAMNPADEAQAFASIIEAGATTEDVARRFGRRARGRKALFLDYDGTLIEFFARPDDAVPNAELRAVLAKLDARGRRDARGGGAAARGGEQCGDLDVFIVLNASCA